MHKTEKLPVGFRYDAVVTDAEGKVIEQWSDLNIIPLLGLNHLLRAPFGDVAPITTFYVGVYRNNALPTSASKAADIPSLLGEFTNYTEATRPLWDKVHDAAGLYSNAANQCEFSFLADQMIYGAFLSSIAEKGSPDGLALSVVRFSTPRMIYGGTKLKITASITYVSADI